MYNYANSTALVTGASSGIGEAIARLLAQRGVRSLVLVARSQDKLEALAEALRAEHGTKALVVAVDLTDEDAAERVKGQTDAHGLHVDLLVNNAGFGSYGLFDERPPERETALVDLNVRALVELTRAFLPALVARGHGGVINVASTAAFQPVPFMATYGATKAFVLSFSEALWAENRDRGVRVVCLCPGGTDTPFDFGSDEMRGRFDARAQSSSEQVAQAALNALDTNASYVVVGRANYLGALSIRLAPRSLVARTVAAAFGPASRQAQKRRPPRFLVVGSAAAGVLAAVLLAYSKRKP